MTCLCRYSNVSRQSFYKARRIRQRKNINEQLVVTLIKRERCQLPNIGIRKLKYLLDGELKANNVHIGRDLLFRVARKHGLLIKRKRRYARTTYSRHGMRTYPNLLKKTKIIAPNQAWVSDITYIRTDEGFVYLSLITDRFSRKIVGYDVGDNLEATGCMKALKMAFKQLPPKYSLIHHSDRGSQYCCYAYINMLKARKVKVSMTEENHCYENSVAERVNGILKHEFYLKDPFKKKSHVRIMVKEVIHLYNTRRPHVALGYATPEEVHLRANSYCYA